MTGTLARAVRIANPSPNVSAVSLSWADLFRSIFPEKTAANTAALARTNVRAVEYVLSGRNGPSGPALINLLRSPVGPQVLDAIAGDAHWRACERRLIEIRQLEDELQNLELKRRELMRTISAPR